MNTFNDYAKELDAAFKTARDAYVTAWDEFQEAAKKRRAVGDGTVQRQRAELDYLEAELAFKDAEKRIWPEFNRKRADIRSRLEADVRSAELVNPDALDANGVELLKSGVLSAGDYYALAEKYDDNPTMLRLIAKYARDAADSMTEAKDRGALHQLAQACATGQGKTMRSWEELSGIADYCSGQARGRKETPTYTINMGKWWEQLSGHLTGGI